MKRAAVCVLLIFILAFGCLCVNAGAAIYYPLWIGDVQVTSDNAADVLKDGKVTFDPTRNTLVLRDADIASTGVRNGHINAGIYASEMDLFIELYGKNTIRTANSQSDTYSGACGIEMIGGSLTVSEGEKGASLDIRGGEDAYMSTGIRIHSGLEGISAERGDYTQNSGKVSVRASKAPASYGIYVQGDVNIISGSFSAIGAAAQTSCGIYVEKNYRYDTQLGSFTDEGGGSVYIEEGASVDARGGFAQLTTSGISAQRSLVITGGKLFAKSDETDKTLLEEYIQESYAVNAYEGIHFTNATVGAQAGDSDIIAGIRSERPISIENSVVSALAAKGTEAYGIRASGELVVADSTIYASSSEAVYSYGMRVTPVESGSSEEEAPYGNGSIVFTNSAISGVAADAQLLSVGISATDNVTINSGRVSASSGDVSGNAASEAYLTSAGLSCDKQLSVYDGIVTASHGIAADEAKRDVHGIFAEKINLFGDFDILGANEEYTPNTCSLTQKEMGLPVILRNKAIEIKSGDVNFDGRISIKDATEIQKHLAKLITLDMLAESVADFDTDGKITVKDATAIQKFIAGIL